jgi:hypothetical protein
VLLGGTAIRWRLCGRAEVNPVGHVLLLAHVLACAPSKACPTDLLMERITDAVTRS